MFYIAIEGSLWENFGMPDEKNSERETQLTYSMSYCLLLVSEIPPFTPIEAPGTYVNACPRATPFYSIWSNSLNLCVGLNLKQIIAPKTCYPTIADIVHRLVKEFLTRQWLTSVNNGISIGQRRDLRYRIWLLHLWQLPVPRSFAYVRLLLAHILRADGWSTLYGPVPAPHYSNSLLRVTLFSIHEVFRRVAISDNVLPKSCCSTTWPMRLSRPSETLTAISAARVQAQLPSYAGATPFVPSMPKSAPVVRVLFQRSARLR